MGRIVFSIIFLFLISINPLFSQNLPLVPYPRKVATSDKYFEFNKNTVIVFSKGMEKEASYLKEEFKFRFGIEIKSLEETARVKSNFIHLYTKADSVQSKYRLEVNPQYIDICGSDAAGVFYGVQTLLQLIPFDKETKIQSVEIEDYPGFSWRGMHLDCSRHFFTVNEVKRYIDYLAMYKMNVFHWHLTDDQGWRIEIKKYPLLTKISSYRKETLIGRPSAKDEYDGKPYGGFYTQEQIKDIVRYASDRHITVVPEIEMPGHSMAVLAAYPNFSCKGGKFETATSWGVFEDVLCAGNDSVFKFLEGVMDEVCDLFPGKYIHIGGDECPKDRWHNCSKCQARMKSEGLKDEHELQSYFIQRIEKYINKKGKQIIGWDEILEGGLAPNAAVMSWRGEQGGVEAAKQKHFVVMTPGHPCYLDHYQYKDVENEPLAIGGYNPLEDVYAYNPVPKELSQEDAKYIYGAQGNVWTEYIPTFKQVEYMALPRMAALAEVLWTYDPNRDYASFIQRLKIQTQILDKLGVNYCNRFKN